MDSKAFLTNNFLNNAYDKKNNMSFRRAIYDMFGGGGMHPLIYSATL
jgi:hypothetical protein